MPEKKKAAGGFGFVDSLSRIFRSKEEAPAPKAQAKPATASRFDALRADFEAALKGVDAKVAEHREKASSTPGASLTGKSAKQLAEEKLRRTEAAYRAIREDIEKMHERLGTGVGGADLDALVVDLEELAGSEDAGRESHELLPRARYVIAGRFGAEAGALAVARLVALLQREKMSWPEPTRYNPTATEDEIERSRRRRLNEVRESFLAQGHKRTSERMLGIVPVWGSDYPDRGSALWEETVLEGVASGIRGALVKEFVELLRKDREEVVARTEEVIGKQLAALQQVLEAGTISLEQANLAVASSLRVLDEVVPDIAWEHVRSRLPRARGEWEDSR